MPLTAINVTNQQHFAYGGVKYMEVSSDYSMAIDDDLAVTETTWNTPARIEFEKETAKMTISSTANETTFRGFEVTIEGYVPNFSLANMNSLREYIDADQNVIAKVFMWEGGNPDESSDTCWLIGWDNVLASNATTTLHGLKLDSIEFDSGAALSDQNGATLKFSCVMGMLPGQIA